MTRAKETREVDVSDEMEQSYIDYAMSVIEGRALPDVRDGLKPVHRRILYAMNQEKITHNTSHRKSSSIVGKTMGDFHPHGDSAIYDTLVRMAQDFSLRYPLVDGQGNFGSIDGDPPAAMRYTEARMAPITKEFMDDLSDPDDDVTTVNFSSTYDDRGMEPDVLPTTFPNLLVNGSSGIAVGMSTNIPPHNLTEVVDATIHLLNNPDATIDDLMEFIKGPDFPTGANIVGYEGVKEAYKTGNGSFNIECEYTVNEDEIIITEIPYKREKEKIIQGIAEDVSEGEIEGVRDIYDESSSEGVRIVIELKNKVAPEIVENHLRSNNHLSKSYSIRLLAIKDGEPEFFNLKEILNEFIEFRKEVVRRRSQNKLSEKKDEEHILKGRIRAVENSEEVVEMIRNSDTTDDAKTTLQEEYDFSQEQAQHIVRMQLGSLTNAEVQELEEEYESVTETIEELNTILENESELEQVVQDELRQVEEKFGDERRTTFTAERGAVSDEELIEEQDVVILLTERGYLKRVNADNFTPQNRGGKGIIGTSLTGDDSVVDVIETTTHTETFCFTDKGNVYSMKPLEIEEKGRNARGVPAVNVLELDDDETVVEVLPLRRDEAEDVVFLTESGYVKRTALDEFTNIRQTGIRAIDLDEEDTIVTVELANESDDILVNTKNGLAPRYPVSDVSRTGRSTRGVKAANLDDDDAVADMVIIEDDSDTLFTVTENGYGKRTEASEYSAHHRPPRGTKDISTGTRNGSVVAAEMVEDGEHVYITSEDGNVIVIPVDDVSVVGRNTKGVRIMECESDVVGMSPTDKR